MHVCIVVVVVVVDTSAREIWTAKRRVEEHPLGRVGRRGLFCRFVSFSCYECACGLCSKTLLCQGCLSDALVLCLCLFGPSKARVFVDDDAVIIRHGDRWLCLGFRKIFETTGDEDKCSLL